eukprot:CAMPEP_0181303204 /NCGR_PEP_ID=MMETSP1101-20121128/8423_1 /TAXON_ID=46948 /ORGANISM="Rhodomonas abbreviata, Strain Caron Lab Isolate" /LENGTH=345 /DNA_ID=CAMNT_0023408741 /DNA_START=10 /DNA_END=1047 /DNA_ORIENTATION=-
MDTIMISERRPSFTFDFTDTMFDLPKCFTPVGDNFDFPQHVWECSTGLVSREQSFGVMMLASEPPAGLISREQSFGVMMQPAAGAAQETFTLHIEDGDSMKSSRSSWMNGLDELFPGGERVLATNEAAPSVIAAAVPILHDQSIDSTVGSKRRAPEEEEEGGEICSEHEWKQIKKQATQKQQKRGAHVKNMPEMQEQAREGQAHWGGKVVELRRQWEEMRMWEHNEEFTEQIRMCRRTHVKSQHECLLRQLQMALVAGWIKAWPFSRSEEESFLGWTGFEVVVEHGAAFRRSIEDMFANVPKDKTLNNALRRAGLVAKEGWVEAWSGLSSFHFVGEKRAHYASKK